MQNCKFLLMSDTHIEARFEYEGRPQYECWKPGFEALKHTYQFINAQFPSLDFALFCGDQVNTGYAHYPEDCKNQMKNYYDTLDTLNLFHEYDPNLAFTQSESGIAPDLTSKVIAIQGNHDVAIRDFYRDCAFTVGNTKFVCFFASYIGLPAAPGKYRSTGNVAPETVQFIEREFANAPAEIEHLVLACHWCISQDEAFIWPLFDACEENQFNPARAQILALCEKYGCDLYINGHEHNNKYPVGKAGILSDINIGTATDTWSVVEIFDDRAEFQVYTTAKANRQTGEIIEEPHFVKKVSVPLQKRSERIHK